MYSADVADGAKLHQRSHMQVANEIQNSSESSTLAGPRHDLPGRHALPDVREQPQWYALYTCPRHEKCVAQQIEQRNISCFLPLYRSVRRWKDRRKELELALFPGYVFVYFALKDRLRVLQLPSAVRLVSFNGEPAVLPQAEIEALRDRLSVAAASNRILTCAPGGASASVADRCRGSKASSCAERNAAAWCFPWI